MDLSRQGGSRFGGAGLPGVAFAGLWTETPTPANLVGPCPTTPRIGSTRACVWAGIGVGYLPGRRFLSTQCEKRRRRPTSFCVGKFGSTCNCKCLHRLEMQPSNLTDPWPARIFGTQCSRKLSEGCQLLVDGIWQNIPRRGGCLRHHEEVLHLVLPCLCQDTRSPIAVLQGLRSWPSWRVRRWSRTAPQHCVQLSRRSHPRPRPSWHVSSVHPSPPL